VKYLFRITFLIEEYLISVDSAYLTPNPCPPEIIGIFDKGEGSLTLMQQSTFLFGLILSFFLPVYLE